MTQGTALHVKEKSIGAVVSICVLVIILSLSVSGLYSRILIPISGTIVTDPRLTLTTSPYPSKLANNVTISGAYTDPLGNPLPHQTLSIQFSFDKTSWSTLRSTETDDHGLYSLVWTPSASGLFWLRAVSASISKISEHIVANSIVATASELQNSMMTRGVVFVREGEYNLSSVLTIISDLCLIGSGEKSIFRVPQNRVSPILYGENVSNVRVARISFDGGSSPTSQNGGSAITFVNSTRIHAESLKIVNLDKEAILFESCKNVTLLRTSISRVWTGVVVRDSQEVTVQENTIDWTAGDGIYVTISPAKIGCTGVTIAKNNLTRIGDTGIDISTPFGGTSYNLKVIENGYVNYNDLSPSEEKNGIGITLSRCVNVEVLGNVVAKSKGGLLIGIAVVNAKIRSNAFSEFSQYGIWVVSTTNLDSNRFSDGNATGIRINPSAGNFAISSNTFSNTSIAIAWIGPAPNIVIQNNTILNPTLYGISDGGEDYWTGGTYIVNNTIADTRAIHKMQYGLYQTSPKGMWTIENNVISGAVLAPMYLTGKNTIIG